MTNGFLDLVLMTTVRALPPALCAVDPDSARAETVLSIEVDLEREASWRRAIETFVEELRDPPVQYFRLPLESNVEVSKVMLSRSTHQAARLTRQFNLDRRAVITTLDVAFSRR